MSLLQHMCHKTQLCRFHLAGMCTRGDSCTFAHGEKDMRQAPDLQNTKLCPNLLDGACYDKECPFAHNSSELKRLPWGANSLPARATSDQIQNSFMDVDGMHTLLQQQQREARLAGDGNPLSWLQQKPTPKLLKTIERMPAKQDWDTENLGSRTQLPARVCMPDANLNQFTPMAPLPFQDHAAMYDIENWRSQAQAPNPLRVPDVNLNQFSPMAPWMPPPQPQIKQAQLQQGLYQEQGPYQEPSMLEPQGIMGYISSVLAASERVEVFKPVPRPVPEQVFKPVNELLKPVYVFDQSHSSQRQSSCEVEEPVFSLMKNSVEENADLRPSEGKPAQRNKFHKTRFCWFFKQGSCSKGKRCNFAHGCDEVQPTPNLHFTKLCPMMLSNGVCTVAGCTYAHSHEELRVPTKDQARCVTFAEPSQQPADMSTETPSVPSEEDIASESGINSTDSNDDSDLGLVHKESWARQCTEDPSLSVVKLMRVKNTFLDFEPADEEMSEAAGIPRLRRAHSAPLIMSFPLDSRAEEAKQQQQQQMQEVLLPQQRMQEVLLPPPGLAPEPLSPQGWPSTPVNSFNLPSFGNGMGGYPLHVAGFGMAGTMG